MGVFFFLRIQAEIIVRPAKAGQDKTRHSLLLLLLLLPTPTAKATNPTHPGRRDRCRVQ
jgi:hypothetical protein